MEQQATGLGEGKNKLVVWDKYVCTAVYKIDNQQETTIQHRELYSISITYNGKESEKRIYVYIYVYESAYYTPETNMTL